MKCCNECACYIANGDLSSLDYYGDAYAERRTAEILAGGEEYGPVALTCSDDCSDESPGGTCEYCGATDMPIGHTFERVPRRVGAETIGDTECVVWRLP